MAVLIKWKFLMSQRETISKDALTIFFIEKNFVIDRGSNPAPPPPPNGAR